MEKESKISQPAKEYSQLKEQEGGRRRKKEELICNGTLFSSKLREAASTIHIRVVKTPPGVLLWCSRLRIQHGHCSSLGGCCGSGSIPGPGTSTGCGCGKRKKKKKDTSSFPINSICLRCFYSKHPNKASIFFLQLQRRDVPKNHSPDPCLG